MDERAILDHQFLLAAYLLTWTIQLGYLAWLGLRWRAQKRAAASSTRSPQVTRQ
jgi:threonine/homoserine/homoserine lactone efflux protein